MKMFSFRFLEWTCSLFLLLDVCFSDEPATYVTSILATLNKELNNGAGKKRLGINDFINMVKRMILF